jgi:mannose-1-phosphate guanylyltransferase/mannose-6-phosphate isomerase
VGLREAPFVNWMIAMINSRPLIALLLVGGAGMRLWPISSEDRPKQFLKLFADRSLFQATLTRVARAEVDEVVIVTGQAYAALVKEQIAELGLRSPHLLLEPIRRDSAAAIAASVAWVQQNLGANAIVAVLPSDHFIPDTAAFARAMNQAAALASDSWLVTFGIRPTAPTTEYGYIQRGKPLAIAGVEIACKVAKFHEKPNRDVAESYLRDGNYDWNSGIFIFTAETFAAEASKHMPDIWETAKEAVTRGERNEGALSFDADAFARARKSSIDYALFEKSDRVAVIPVDFAWHDIGNWGSAYDAFHAEPDANVVIGDALLDEVTGTIVVADGVKVVVCGMSDIVVIASKEGTFVAPRSRAAEIKRLLGG